MNSTNQQIKQLYQDKYKKYGVSPKALFWHGKGAAHQRFRQMWAEIDFNNKSVLDVGCGFGEMGKFLLRRYKGVSYTGVDIVPEFIKEAKNLLPEGRFEVRDYFENPLEEKFDIVLASGTINSNVGDNVKNKKWREKAINVMFMHTKKTLIFNMLGAHPQPENDPNSNIWYADSLEVLKYCMSLTRRVVLRANYHPTDFTILMYNTLGTRKF